MADDDPFLSKQLATDAAEQSAEVRRAFGDALRRSRQNAGISPARVEELTGITEAELLQIEGGATDPALATLAALVKAIESDIVTLLLEASL